MIMAKTTYKHLTGSRAFRIAREAAEDGHDFEVQENDQDGLAVIVYDKEGTLWTGFGGNTYEQ